VWYAADDNARTLAGPFRYLYNAMAFMGVAMKGRGPLAYAKAAPRLPEGKRAVKGPEGAALAKGGYRLVAEGNMRKESKYRKTTEPDTNTWPNDRAG
jgi:hypothetical protein